jgi:hypothetical protein
MNEKKGILLESVLRWSPPGGVGGDEEGGGRRMKKRRRGRSHAFGCAKYQFCCGRNLGIGRENLEEQITVKMYDGRRN